MQSRLLATTAILFACTITCRAAPPIELELATERGVQITAPHEWLQRLTALGIDSVRIRGAQPGDEPSVENRGSADRPRYHVLGILTARNQLVVPGGTFSRGDSSRLKDYFEQVAADGGEALTAPRGMFGLTDKEIEAVFADLTQPIEFETDGQTPSAVIHRLQSALNLNIVPDAEAERSLRNTEAVADELKGLTVGTGLAMMLRSNGLALRPHKPLGEPIRYIVEPAGDDLLAADSRGKPSDHAMSHWPIGWEPQRSPRETAPVLFEYLNAEIDGYSLEEALTAIGPRIKIPLYFDHAALAAYDIDPAKVQVRFPRARTFYKRVIDRVLAQARLGSQLRVDESGAPFLWITR